MPQAALRIAAVASIRVSGTERCTVSAIIVSFADPAATRAAVESLYAQTRPPDEVIVVDNHPGAPAAAALDGLDVDLVRPSHNLGFAPACNLAAQRARGDWLFVLNPDAVAERECLERLLEATGDDVGLVGAQVLMPDGVRVNAGDNPLHLAGLSWSGRYLERREDGPPRDAAVVSGAAMLVRARAFRALEGFPPGFFLYQEDVDLAWRLRLAGWRVRFCPRAAVRHDYEFAKGRSKWFWLERNRLWVVLCNYDARTLLALAPLLAGVEVGVLLLAVRAGWLGEKLRAYGALLRALPLLARRRRCVQRSRRVADRELLEAMVGRMETPLLDSPLLAVGNPLMERYRRVLLALLARRS
jgi:GT2 family glycosyltransferase